MGTDKATSGMMKRYLVYFDPDAAKEYNALDGSVSLLVDKAIEELTVRADKVGKPLGNKQNLKLAGCREIKFRDAGLRIIFRITNEKVDILRIVFVLAISKREDFQVYKLAAKRSVKPTVINTSVGSVLQRHGN